MMKCKICSLVIIVAVFACTAFSESKIEDPYKIKSTYIISFIKYLEWEKKDVLPDDQSPIVIGIYSGEEENAQKYYSFLEGFSKIINDNPTMQKKLSKNHPLEIKYFKALDEITPCHILFIPSLKTLFNLRSSNESHKTADILNPIVKKLDGFPSLLVGDYEGFAETMGGHINFVLVKGRIEFIINLAALKKSGIQVRYSLIENAYDPNKGKKE